MNIIKKISNRKALLLLSMFVACLVLPMSAQYSDGFIIDDKSYEDRESNSIGFNIGTQPFGSDDNGGYNISTQQFGQDVPVGCGLLILFGAGVSYAAMKRTRRNLINKYANNKVSK